MATIVITEFMDEAAVAMLGARHATLYDPGLVDRPADLEAAVGDARALVVRNRTAVRGDLLACRDGARGRGPARRRPRQYRPRRLQGAWHPGHPGDGRQRPRRRRICRHPAAMLLRPAYGATAAMLRRGMAARGADGPGAAGKTMGPRRPRRHSAPVKRKAMVSACGCRLRPYLPNGDDAWDNVGSAIFRAFSRGRHPLPACPARRDDAEPHRR